MTSRGLTGVNVPYVLNRQNGRTLVWFQEGVAGFISNWYGVGQRRYAFTRYFPGHVPRKYIPTDASDISIIR